MVFVGDQPPQGCAVAVQRPAVRAHERRNAARAEQVEPALDERDVQVGAVVELRQVAPGTAPVDPLVALGSTSRVNLFLSSVVAEPVLAPLPHVAVHVVEPELVRRQFPHRMDFVERGRSEPLCYLRAQEPLETYFLVRSLAPYGQL